MRPRGLKQIGEDVIDLRDLQTNIFHNRACWTGHGKVASYYFDDASNAR